MGRQALPLGTWGAIGTGELGDGRMKAWARYRDLDGKSRVVMAYGRTEDRAVRAVREKLANRARVNTSTDNITGNSTVEALGKYWLKRKIRVGKPDGTRYAKGSIVYYQGGLTVVNQGLGGLRLSEVTPSLLEKFLDKLVEKRAPSAPKQARKCLSGMFRLATRHGAIDSNPAGDLSPVPQTQKDVKALTILQVQALRNTIIAWENRPVVDQKTGKPMLRSDGTPVGKSGPPSVNPLSDIFDILAGTGLRIGECLALLWDDINLEASPPTLTVTGTIANEAPFDRQPAPKSVASRRTVYLPPFVVAVLMRRRMDSPASNVFGAVFYTRRGGWVRAYNVRKALRQAVKGTHFEGISPHALRTAVATHIANSEDSETAAAQLGHGSDVITKKHYIESGPNPAAPNVNAHLEAFGPGRD